MSTRIQNARRGAAALAVVASLALGVTACSDDEPAAKPQGGPSEKKESGGSDKADNVPATDEVLTRIEGPEGIVLTLNEVKRDSGGFVTVTGKVENTSDESFSGASAWRGDEEEILKHGSSLGGAMLVDKAEKKRYYILRDTDGRPLATKITGLIGAGETIPVYMQFPAPPESSKQVDLQLPEMPSATVEISQ